jgi:hypothetical protein
VPYANMRRQRVKIMSHASRPVANNEVRPNSVMSHFACFVPGMLIFVSGGDAIVVVVFEIRSRDAQKIAMRFRVMVPIQYRVGSASSSSLFGFPELEDYDDSLI